MTALPMQALEREGALRAQTKEQVGTYVVGSVAFMQGQELLGMEYQCRVCCPSAYLQASDISQYLMQQTS